MRAPRSSLATRIALLSVGIVVLTGLVAGFLAVGLIRKNGADDGRKTLRRFADVGQAVVSNGGLGQKKLRTALQESNIRVGLVSDAGTIATSLQTIRRAVHPSDVARIRSGKTVSAGRTVNGRYFLIEGRPITGRPGVIGIVVIQARQDATAQSDRAIQRILLALVIAGGVAVLIGLLVAWRLARPLRRTAAAARSVAAGNRDVTLPAVGPAEVVEVSEAVNSIAGALRHSEGRQREFLLSVSHDLRTPLTAISGYAESLADGVVPNDETSHVGAVVLGESKRLERLVGDLLDLARLGADDFRVEFARVDLVPLAAAAARVWTSRSTPDGVELRFEPTPHPVWVDTDPARLRQVLDGLFDNALRVTPAGAPIVLAVRTESERTESTRAAIEVRDGGPGLTDDDLPVAFEQGALYERYRGVRQVGTGLGLAIVHGLVARLGGRIEAGHAAEGGARFTVTLPLE
ncbi:MAG: sensor histidine kinase [Jatrophihabitans sp.]